MQAPSLLVHRVPASVPALCCPPQCRSCPQCCQARRQSSVLRATYTTATPAALRCACCRRGPHLTGVQISVGRGGCCRRRLRRHGRCGRPPCCCACCGSRMILACSAAALHRGAAAGCCQPFTNVNASPRPLPAVWGRRKAEEQGWLNFQPHLYAYEQQQQLFGPALADALAQLRWVASSWACCRGSTVIHGGVCCAQDQGGGLPYTS